MLLYFSVIDFSLKNEGKKYWVLWVVRESEETMIKTIIV